MSLSYYLQHKSKNHFIALSDATSLFCNKSIWNDADLSSDLPALTEEELLSNKQAIMLKRRKSYDMRSSAVNLYSDLYEISTHSKRQQLWKQYGLNVKEELENERLFLITIFELHMLSWYRVNGQLDRIGNQRFITRDLNGQVTDDDSILLEKTLRQIEVVASRALYAYELDAGVVLLAVSGTGSLAVRKIWSLLDIPIQFDYEMIREGFKQYEHSISRQTAQENVLIGADPEFVLINQQNKIVSASTFFEGYLQEELGADAIMYQGKMIYPLVELRPAPKETPKQLYREIYSLLLDATHYIKDKQLEWLAGAMPHKGLALGGHIHLSGIVLTPRLLRLLDRGVAMVLAAIEDPLGRGRYARYGGLGDYRRQSHGGFEYRTPPSWLVSPAVAKCSLLLAYTCAVHFEELSEREIYCARWVKAYYEGDYATLSECSRKMLDWMKSVYKDTEQDFHAIIHAMEHKKHWDEHIDIRKRWGIQ